MVNDFKKALGILQKAKQASMFEKDPYDTAQVKTEHGKNFKLTSHTLKNIKWWDHEVLANAHAGLAAIHREQAYKHESVRAGEAHRAWAEFHARADIHHHQSMMASYSGNTLEQNERHRRGALLAGGSADRAFSEARATDGGLKAMQVAKKRYDDER